MNKKTLAAIVAILILICAISAFALVRCTDAEDVSKDISSENSESSDVDESTVSEPSDASEAEESLADPSEPSESSIDDVSNASEETSTPAETSKVEEPSQPDEPSEPEDTSATTPSEIVKPNEESKVEETSKDETSKNETSKEEAVVKGDTPVEIVVNGKEHTVKSYEDAVEVVTLENFENAEKGYVIVLEVRGVTLTFVANGDGTFVNTETGRSRSAQQVYDTYISQWCSHCGQRKGAQGENGTCVRFLVDTECPKCGEFCKALDCHTCDE